MAKNNLDKAAPKGAVRFSITLSEEQKKGPLMRSSLKFK